MSSLPQQPYDGVLRPADAAIAERRDALLPTLFRSSHGSFLFRTRAGQLLLAWFSGQGEGADGCAIVVSRFVPGRWTAPVVASVESGASNQNPVLFQTADSDDATVYLLHTAQNCAGLLGVNQSTSRVMLVRSHDNGETWGAPQLLFPQGAGTFLRAPVVVSSDQSTLLLPLYFTPDGAGDYRAQYSAIWHVPNCEQLIRERGEWRKLAVVPGSHRGVGVQPSVVRLGDKLVALLRNRTGGKIMRSVSLDDGATWSHAEPTPLNSNNSGIAAIAFDNNRRILICFNDAAIGCRWPLSLAVSDDGGASFHSQRNLADDPRLRQYEFSYPTMLLDHDDSRVVHVAWTHARQTIAYARIVTNTMEEQPQ
jgi:predicted neuraminidase